MDERYLTPAMIYVALGLIVAGVTPEVSTAFAQTGGCTGEPSCPSGTYCCSGTCIPSDYICCDDWNGPQKLVQVLYAFRSNGYVKAITARSTAPARPSWPVPLLAHQLLQNVHLQPFVIAFAAILLHLGHIH